MVTRRQFLKGGIALGALASVPGIVTLGGARAAQAAQSPQIPLPGAAIPQFVDALPDLHTIVHDGTSEIALRMAEFQYRMMPSTFVGPNPAQPYAGTWVWGYRTASTPDESSYIGPVIVAKRGTPTSIRWINDLGSAADTQVLAYRYATDQTLHWADPLGGGKSHYAHLANAPAFGSPAAENYAGPIPAVAHLHGGEVPPQLDGGPDSWFTSDGAYHGHAFHAGPGGGGNVSVYNYPNTQEAAPIWFHDHVLGATRLNVYAGLAGGYLVTDGTLKLPDNLPGPADIIPLVIQDRRFDVDGQLFFPADSAGNVLWTPNPEHPYWVPEFEGDTICVNGKVWPYRAVDRRRYRFLFLNGSNARTYSMVLSDPVTGVDGPPLWVIGTDGGYLDRPVRLDPNAKVPQRLVMMPGERYEVIIDFGDPAWLRLNRRFSGTLILRNNAKTPFPAGVAPAGNTLGRIMQFRVSPGSVDDTSFNPASGAALRPAGREIVRLVDPVTGQPSAAVQKTRLLTLNEVMAMPKTAIDPVTGVLTAYPGGPLEALVNNTKWGGERIVGTTTSGHKELVWDMEPIPGFTSDGKGNWISELPQEGETELWEIVNLTADAHPIHLHLVQFQIANRQMFNVNTYNAAYNAAFPAGYDYSMKMAMGPGAFLPAWGPPLPIDGSGAANGKLGGNPDVTPFLQGPVRPPLPEEAGWKDTVIAYPGQVTRLMVRWGPTDKPAGTPFPFNPNGGHGYVWHCHIIDHEDNEMMRPDVVQPLVNAPRDFELGVDY